jgi:predicted NBD/HSP70 family sugar kinase
VDNDSGVTDRTVLTVDVGGSRVKARVSTEPERRRFRSDGRLSAPDMVDRVLELTDGWSYDVVTVGVPTLVRAGRIVRDPVNLHGEWVGFDFEAAFGKPTKVINDAAMQALGSYDGGRMLFLGFGTGLGSALIVDGVIAPMELGHMPWKKKTYEDYVGERGLQRLGHKRWCKAVLETVDIFATALEPDYVVLGGGNVDDLGDLPPNVRRGDNENAFLGGFRLWDPPAG